MLLVVGTDSRVELVHTAAILVVLEYSLAVEIASSGHEASEDDSLRLSPKGNVCGGYFLLIISGCCGGRGRGSRVPIDSAACQQSGHDDMGVILGASEISHNLHIPVREVVLCEDWEASMGTVANIHRFSIGHEF